MSRKRLVPAFALLAVFAPGGPSVEAQDDTMGVAACVFDPFGVVADVAPPATNGVNHVLPGGAADPGGDWVNGGAWDPGQLLDSDPGPLTIAGGATCAGLDAASEHALGGPTALGPVDMTLVGTGGFNDLICGTGTVNGRVNLFDTATAGAVISIWADFHMTVVGGAGTLLVEVRNDPAVGAFSFAAGNDIDGGGGMGVVDVIPTTTAGNCLLANVTDVFVNGAFYSTLSGEGAAVGPPGDSDL